MSQLFNICLSNACCKSDALLRTIFSFNNYLLSAYSVPGTVLGPGIKQWTKLQSTRLHGPVKERTNKPKIVSMSRMMHALRKSREQTVWVLGLLASCVGFPAQNGRVGATACRPSSGLKESIWGEALRALGEGGEASPGSGGRFPRLSSATASVLPAPCRWCGGLSPTFAGR